MLRTVARRVGALLSLGMSALSAASAQSGRGAGEVTRTPGGTVSVRLLVRPRVGDTLRLQMEQTIEVSRRTVPPGAAQGAPVIDGTRTSPRTPVRAPSVDYGPRRARAGARITRLQLYAHSLVEASDLTITTLLATTDSMAMWAGAPGATGTPRMMPLPLEGRQVRVRVAPDGSMRVNDPPPGAMELGATLASIPGMLPTDAVRVGDTWERDIAMPSVPVSGYRADGVVRASFRLDSLTQGGRNAWISLDGSMHRDGSVRELPAGTRVITAGTLRGLLVVDRQRAWIVDARTLMDVQSEVTPAAGGAVVVLDMRITQRVRVK
mgnify:CR=1 FL=1